VLPAAQPSIMTGSRALEDADRSISDRVAALDAALANFGLATRRDGDEAER
jgi:hypothetical protein